MHHVLVMAAGSPLGQGIIKALKKSELDLDITAADIDNLAAGLHFENVHKTILPLIKEEGYWDALLALIRDNNIQFIFPVLEGEHSILHQKKSALHAMGVHVLASELDVYRVCSDKYESMKRLKDAGLHCPETIVAGNENEIHAFVRSFGFPLFLKPLRGVSNADTFKINHQKQLDALLTAYPSNYFVLQQFLADENDYTAGVYISKCHTLKECLVIQRDLKFGLSYRGKVLLNKTLEHYCISVAEALNTNYSANIQFKVVDNTPYAYEINPRLSSTTFVRASMGFNEPEMMILEALQKVQHIKINKRAGSFSRYWEELFFF